MTQPYAASCGGHTTPPWPWQEQSHLSPETAVSPHPGARLGKAHKLVCPWACSLARAHTQEALRVHGHAQAQMRTRRCLSMEHVSAERGSCRPLPRVWVQGVPSTQANDLTNRSTHEHGHLRASA